MAPLAAWSVVRIAASGRKTTRNADVAQANGQRPLASGQAAEMERLVRIFDTETLQGRQSFSVHDRPIASLAWHPSRHILATAPAGLTTKLWNPDTGRRLDTFRGPTVAPRVLNFSPSGQRLACAGLDRATRVWEPLSLQQTEGSK